MTLIDFMHAHPFITFLVILVGIEAIQCSVHYISNVMVVRAQLNAGIPAAQVVRLQNKGVWIRLKFRKNRDEGKESRP